MTDHVKVYGIKPRIQYVADGILTTYEFPYAIFKTSDINVYFGNVLQDTSTYTVSEARHSDGGSVTFETAPASGTIITIMRNLSVERTSDFQESSTLRAKVLNDELDYQIACQQQIAENLNRSMVLPPYATDNDLDLTLPMPEAGKALVWNEEGTNLENSTISVNALESTIKSYKESAESAANTATEKATVATTEAQTAITQAGVATAKATEATSAVNQLNGMRTNCITEIPQDVKLELNNGVLTLKAGSKAYKKSDTTTPSYILTSDKSVSQTTDGIYFVSYDGTNLVTYLTTAYDYSALPNDFSLPLGIIMISDGEISAINQIFNGFGYIGSSVFILPGIKGLIPNGRNADGTLKSNNITIQSLLTKTIPSNTGWHYLVFNQQGVSCDFATNFYIGKSLPETATNYSRFYDTNENKIYLVVSGNKTATNTLVPAIRIEHNTSSPYAITNIQKATVFQAVDHSEAVKYTDSALINTWNAPDYTSGVNIGLGVDYTAPSNGYIVSFVGNTAGDHFVKIDGHIVIEHLSNASLYNDSTMVPIAKGSVVHSYYETGALEFYPCLGG